MADFQQNFLASLQGGLNIGQQVRGVQDRNKINQLASLAYQAPASQRQEILGQAAAVDAGQAGALDRQLGNSDDQRNKTMANMAQLLVNAPEQARAGLYQQMVPTLAKFGLQDLPQQYDAQTAPIIDQAARSIYQAYSGGGGASGVQSTYVDNNGQRVAIMRDGSTQILGGNDVGSNQQTLTIDVNGTPTQVTFDRRTGRYTNAALGAPAQQAPQQAPQGGYQQINGQQTYIDPSLPPQVQQQIRQSLASGQEPPAQMAFAGQPGQQGTPLTGRRAEDQAAAVEQARINAQNQNFETEIDQKRRLAEQQAQIDADKAKAVEQAKSDQERASNERAKTAQLNNVDRGLTRIDSALKGLNGRFVNTGPIDGRLIGPTPEGQELEAAVGAIQNDVLALTRVPGIGSQSDLEAKIANLKYPSIYNAPEVNARNVQQLKAFIGDLRQQIQTAPTQGQGGEQSQGASAGGAPRQIQSAEEYNALPSGALFIAPDGTQRRKR